MTSKDDDNDEDVADLTPEDEQAVADLLAALPATPMPPEVLARIEAALAAEPALAATAGVTTLAAGRERRRPARGPLVFRIAASVLAVVGLTALGVAFVNGGGATSEDSGATADQAEGTSSSAAGGGSAVPAASAAASGVRVTTSGKTYTPDNLAAQATALLALVPTSLTPSAPASVGADFGAKALARTPDKLAACVKELTDGDGRTPLAVDTGRWNNVPALVIVLPADGTADQRQVFVVKPTCGTVDDSSDILQVAFLDK